MTIIVVKDGVMCSDTGSWQGDIVADCGSKIYRLDDGSLFGAAGWKPVILEALEWLKAGHPADKKPAEAKEEWLEGVWLKRNGAILIVDSTYRIYETDYPFSVAGQHHEFLIGAMLAGASAEEAAGLALRHCRNVAGHIEVFRLE